MSRPAAPPVIASSRNRPMRRASPGWPRRATPAAPVRCARLLRHHRQRPPSARPGGRHPRQLSRSHGRGRHSSSTKAEAILARFQRCRGGSAVLHPQKRVERNRRRRAAGERRRAFIYLSEPAWQTGPGVPDDNARDIPDISFSAVGQPRSYLVSQRQRPASHRRNVGRRALLRRSAGACSTNTWCRLGAVHGLGNINPELYRLARVTTDVFHDITQGNNLVPVRAGSPDCSNGSLGFSAGPVTIWRPVWVRVDVYNLVTQWGAPRRHLHCAHRQSFRHHTGRHRAVASPPWARRMYFPHAICPGGTVTFSSAAPFWAPPRYSAPAGAALATLTVTGPRLPAGNANMTATYTAMPTTADRRATAVVTVAATSAGSVGPLTITPNPAHDGQFVR